ncbi:hypothetical protein Btru_062917 [Bulinus truncatus]|nr:hypothetical protein Btru_062917 [Bulinus truncatus]
MGSGCARLTLVVDVPARMTLSMAFILVTTLVGVLYISVNGTTQDVKNRQVEHNPCDVRTAGSDTLVDCSGRSLTSVFKSWFPENTTEILLQDNQLAVIPNCTLDNLYGLRRLSVQDNRLTYIESAAFQGLVNLNYLNLEGNQLELFSLPVDVFHDLINLNELRLIQKDTGYNRNTLTSRKVNNGNFPDRMFGYLQNLTSLAISVSGDLIYFNLDFTKLNKLSNLQITGTVSVITLDSFQNVRLVRNLKISNIPNIVNFNDSALQPFDKLDSIIYEYVEIGVNNALRTLCPLVNTSLQYFRIMRVQIRPNLKFVSILTRDGIIDRVSTQYLRGICVEELRLESSNIFVIVEGALQSPTLDRCLRRVYILDNPILGTPLVLVHLMTQTMLNTLVMRSSFGFALDLGSGKLVQDGLMDTHLHLTELGTLATRKETLHEGIPNKHDIISSNNSRSIPNEITIRISDSIDYLDVSTLFRLIYFNVKCKILGGQNLSHLYLIDDGIENAQYGIEGLPNLRTLNISYNKLSSLSPDFFSAYRTLEVLSLFSCQLSSKFMSIFSGSLFINLSNLQVLDLSFNSLDSLAPGTFSTNTNLTSLNLAGNRFRNLPFDLRLTPNLTFLDLRQNALSSIDSSDREIMEEQVKKLGKFQLAMSGNILSCGCENLPFLRWLQDTNIQLDDHRNYTCLDHTGLTSYTLVYGDLTGLWRECWCQSFFNISLGLFCLTLVGFLSVFMWMKSKTLIMSGVLQIFTGFKLKKSSDYQYGVFIGYADKDYQFACFSLRHFVENDLGFSTFIRDRDLLLSTVFAQGLMEAINSSWRIILVVNQSFTDQNDWFMYTIRSAVYSVSPANPSRVVILVDRRYIDQLPLELLNSVPEDNLIIVKKWQLTYELKQSLKTRLI